MYALTNYTQISYLAYIIELFSELLNNLNLFPNISMTLLPVLSILRCLIHLVPYHSRL